MIDPRITEANRKLQEDTLDEIRIRLTNLDINMKRLLDAHIEHFKKWEKKNFEQ